MPSGGFRILRGAPHPPQSPDQEREDCVRFTKWICVLLVAVILATVAQPARAEAMDPILISLIVSGAIVVVALIAILIIANASEGRRRRGEDTTPPERLVAFQYVVISTQPIASQLAETESP